MMLYLVRHGIALPHGTPGMDDDDRPLTDEGRRRLKGVVRGLAHLGVTADAIITSPLPRARQTAEIVADGLDLRDRLENADVLRSGRGAEAIADWLVSRDESNLILVGHNPEFSELVGLLTTGSPRLVTELRRGGVAALTRSAPGAGCTLDWLARPRLLRQLG